MNALGFAMLALNHDDEGEALENIARARTHLSSAEADYIAAADELTDADGAVIDSLIGAAWASVAAAEKTLPVE